MQYIKYPRTEHLIGSKVLDYDNFNSSIKDTNSTHFPILLDNQYFVVEEKMDGIGLGICFIKDNIFISQRGHLFPLSHTPNLLKNFVSWVNYNEELLYLLLGNRYTLFGEWLEYKHTVFYNNLPSLFLEYDIYDHTENMFLSTEQRYTLLDNQLPSVKVLQQTKTLQLSDIYTLLNQKQSCFNNDCWNNDYQTMIKQFPQAQQDTLLQGSYEGFYIKVENSTQTFNRFKFIRKQFFDIVQKNQHWKDKPLIKNKLSSVSLHLQPNYLQY